MRSRLALTSVRGRAEHHAFSRGCGGCPSERVFTALTTLGGPHGPPTYRHKLPRLAPGSCACRTFVQASASGVAMAYVRCMCARAARASNATTVLSSSDPWRAGPPFLTWRRDLAFLGALVSVFLSTTREQGAMGMEQVSKGQYAHGGERCQTAGLEETSTTSRRRCEGQLFRSRALCVAQRSFFAAGPRGHRRVPGRKPRGVSANTTGILRPDVIPECRPRNHTEI
jgi:hypothetical protein